MYTIVRRSADKPRRLLCGRRYLRHGLPLRVQRCRRSRTLHHGLIAAHECDEVADAHDAEIAALGASAPRPHPATRAARRDTAGAECAHAACRAAPCRARTRRPRPLPADRAAASACRHSDTRCAASALSLPSMSRGKILGRCEIPVIVAGRRIATPEHAVLDRQFRRTAIQPTRQSIQHTRAQLRGDQPHRTARHLDRLAARGLTFVRRLFGIARQHRDARQVHVQFIGSDLRQRGDIALAQLHLAYRKPYGAVRFEPEPLLHAAIVLDRQRQCVAHARFPSRSMAAAFSTARRMRGCAPQRHRFLSNAATISARDGDGLRSSSAFALMMMPDRQ